jgi:TldD protein
MKDLLMRAVDLARGRGAEYADVRIVHNLSENISVRNGVTDRLSRQETIGFGVRVLGVGARPDRAD